MTNLTRRAFLPMLASAVLAPRYGLSANPNPIVTINSYLNDVQADTAHKTGIMKEVFGKVTDFYEGAGQEKGLPGIGLQFKLISKRQYEKSPRDNTNFTLRYTSIEDIKSNPREILQAYGGEQYVARLNELISSTANLKKIRYDKAENEVFEKELGVIYENLKKQWGVGSSSAKKIWLFAKEQPPYYSEQQIINFMATVTAHELGHVFGLEHTAGERSNLMNDQPDEDTTISFTPTLSKGQLEKILCTL